MMSPRFSAPLDSLPREGREIVVDHPRREKLAALECVYVDPKRAYDVVDRPEAHFVRPQLVVQTELFSERRSDQNGELRAGEIPESCGFFGLGNAHLST
jgi:hypothetical protein